MDLFFYLLPSSSYPARLFIEREGSENLEFTGFNPDFGRAVEGIEARRLVYSIVYSLELSLFTK